MPDQKPPAIASMRAQGVAAITVHCVTYPCGHSGRITFDETGLPDHVPIIHILKLRRFICTRCGPRHAEIFPDWTAAAAPGNDFDRGCYATTAGREHAVITDFAARIPP